MAEVGDQRKAAFLKWLGAVDEEAFGEDILQAVQKQLEEAQFADARSLRGASEDEVAALWEGNVGVRAFLRRCVKAANIDDTMVSSSKLAGATGGGPGGELSREDLQE